MAPLRTGAYSKQPRVWKDPLGSQGKTPAANTSGAQKQPEKRAGKLSCCHGGPSPTTSPAPPATLLRLWQPVDKSTEFAVIKHGRV